MATTDAAPSGDENAAPTVCRFLISQLRAGTNLSDCDYYVDLVLHKHSLYDIVVQVFEEIWSKKLTSESMHRHLWSFKWIGRVYVNGWRDAPRWSQDEMGASGNHIDEKEPRLLANLGLEAGQRGRFEGQSALFSVTLIEMNGVIASSIDSYPQTTPVPQNFTNKLDADWLSDEEKQQCEVLIEKWCEYFNGDNAWRRKRDYDREGPRYELKKPAFPEWRPEEVLLMGLLINADCKFKKSWSSILQFAFPDRRETACSGMFYKLKGNQNYRVAGFGQGLASSELVLQAKTMAKGRMREFLASGPPKIGPNPEVEAERALRKRGIIDDDTDPDVKRSRILEFAACPW